MNRSNLAPDQVAIGVPYLLVPAAAIWVFMITYWTQHGLLSGRSIVMIGFVVVFALHAWTTFVKGK